MMRILFAISLTSAALFLNACEKPQLNVYIASKDAGPGLHQANVTAFPDLGYVAEKPDLTISELEGVSFGPPRRLPGEKRGERPPEDQTVLVLRLTKKDAGSLNQFTSKHIGDRLLMLLNDDPLFAPEITMPSIGESVYVTPPTGTNTAKIKAKLETLLKKSK